MASEREGQEPRDPSTKATCRGLQRVSNKAAKERPGARGPRAISRRAPATTAASVHSTATATKADFSAPSHCADTAAGLHTPHESKSERRTANGRWRQTKLQTAVAVTLGWIYGII